MSSAFGFLGMSPFLDDMQPHPHAGLTAATHPARGSPPVVDIDAVHVDEDDALVLQELFFLDDPVAKSTELPSIKSEPSSDMEDENDDDHGDDDMEPTPFVRQPHDSPMPTAAASAAATAATAAAAAASAAIKRREVEHISPVARGRSASSATDSSTSSPPHDKSRASKQSLPAEVLAQLPLPPRTANQDQRERNRLIVKRCYYKKISTLNELRGEVERMQTKYQQLLREKQAECARPSTAEQLSENRTPAQKMHKAYVDLALLAESLRIENEQLREADAEYSKMVKQVSQLHVSQRKNLSIAEQAQEHKRKNPIVELKALTLPECIEIAREAYRQMMAFRENKAKHFTTGASVFGWRDRHQIKNNKLYFSLEKVFSGCSMEYIANAAWELLSNPEALAKTYSPRLDVHFHVVQRINENNLVFYHTLERPGHDLRIKALILCSRLHLGGDLGQLIVFRGLNPKEYLIREGEPPRPRDRRGRNKIEPQKEDIWIDTFVWGHFREMADGKSFCDDFGGIVDGTRLLSTTWWMVEMLQFALRLEAQVVGPPFVLEM
ncbi:hypothetical protein P43SY_004691 [Pythium insidiosum]|uniref:Uncharacterized protein n=1 Tax=Pythium insidiosum TaxID=114742 RepID=A0AAD5Q5G8_PYTIN|nr:hypothetical protein P43SY_004691 [Pythium insidiosum]